ncbi:MAG: hypothetical protein WC508_01100 [Patescibacteria group bacterium]
MEKPLPTKRVPVGPGSSTIYEGVRIEVRPGGGLRVNGSTDQHCLEFNRGVGGSCRVVALLQGPEVLIFTGSVVGPSMINRQMVLESYGLA